MRHLSIILIAAGLAVSGAAAKDCLPGTKAVYNKWHETELERWLSDHDVPYPTPAVRRDLEALVDKYWRDLVVKPYKDSAVRDQAEEARVKAEDTIVSRAKAHWHETENCASQAWATVKDWIFDTWSESQLKAFCDRHDIPVPQPRQRDTLLQKVRSSYESVAKKVGQTAAYPGDWLYTTWSESDLKSWLDSHGFPAPQPSTRDKLIASVRRNSRFAYLKAQEEAASASASAQAAYATLTDKIIDAWSESQLKEFCDKNGIPVPQGTKANELRALVRKHRAKASDSASRAAQDAFNQAIGVWSESRLKAYLDARGVPVPHGSKMDELRALARKHSHKASTAWNARNFDDFSRENLKQYLVQQGDAAAKTVAKKTDATRDELVRAAQSAYSSASTAGGAIFASATSYVASVTATAKGRAFDAWSETDLKAYLDSYGIPVPQGSKLEELKALARRHRTYFEYGTSSPGETFLAKLEETARDSWNWVANQLKLGNEAARKQATEAGEKVKEKVDGIREEL